MITQLAVILALAPSSVLPGRQEADLVRRFQVGEKLTYEFVSRLNIDFREGNLETFIPLRHTYRYTFTLSTEKEKPEGAADVRFERDKIVQQTGETFYSSPKEEKVGRKENILYTFSRRNRAIGRKDESPEEEKKEPPPFLMSMNAEPVQFGYGRWVAQMYGLAAFVRFFDFGPVLPNRRVSEGDTWKETKGYGPLTLTSGADKGKNIVGRLDLTYTYKGNTEVDGKQVVWIEGRLEQDTDAAPYVADLFGIDLKDSPFTEIRLIFEAAVDYYLEPGSLQVYAIKAQFQGSTAVTRAGWEGGPWREDRFRSRASLTRK